MSPTPPADGCAGRVLVVDDDDALRVSTSRMLQTLGYQVSAAADAAAAIRLAREASAPLDVLVCDLALAGESGLVVADHVRLLYPDIKVLLISGYPRGAARQKPGESFLQKPYDRDELRRQLVLLGVSSR
jgi:CheY-like chemotaxis protein